MDRSDISRRDIIRAGAAGTGVVTLGGIGAFATGRAELPAGIRCRLGEPRSMKFTPSEELESTEGNPEKETFQQTIVSRIQIAHKHGLLTAMPIDAVAYEDGSVQVYFDDHVTNAADIHHVVQPVGQIRVTISGADGEEQTAFESKGYNRTSQIEELDGSGWAASVPLSQQYVPDDPQSPEDESTEETEDGPSEVENFQTTLEETEPQSDDTYAIRLYFEGNLIREAALQPDGVEQFLADDWDAVMPFSQLSQRDAVALGARFNGGALPVAAEVTNLCETTENDQRESPVEDDTNSSEDGSTDEPEIDESGTDSDSGSNNESAE